MDTHGISCRPNDDPVGCISQTSSQNGNAAYRNSSSSHEEPMGCVPNAKRERYEGSGPFSEHPENKVSKVRGREFEEMIVLDIGKPNKCSKSIPKHPESQRERGKHLIGEGSQQGVPEMNLSEMCSEEKHRQKKDRPCAYLRR